MKIEEIQPNQGNIDVVFDVVEKGDERTFEKFGKQGRVCNCNVKDETGTIKLTLWNEDVDKVKEGDKIHLKNGWCSEFKGERQLSAGKFGELEVLENSSAQETQEEPKAPEPEQVPEERPTEETKEDTPEESTDTEGSESSESLVEEEVVG